MRRIFSPLLAVALSVVIVTACSDDDTPTNPDPVVQSDMDLTGFSKIEMKDGFTATVNIQGQTDVKVDFNESIRDYVKVMTVDSTLKLEIEGELDRVQGKTYSATVGMPALVEIGITDGAKLTVNSSVVTGPWFKGDLKEGSQMNGTITTSSFEMKADGGSKATLNGSASTGKIEVDHGATIDLRDYTLLGADIEANNGGIVYVNVNGLINVKAYGGSKIYYRGTVQLGDVDLKGGSTLEAF